nr:TBC1 domain family member 19-like isoform X2 [Nerophis lumbriciformis]
MMEEDAEVSVMVSLLVQRLNGSHLHSEIEQRAKECLHQPEIKLECLKEDVRHFLKSSGWEKKLQNAVYRELQIQTPPSHPAAPAEHLKEPLAYMRKAQASWERRILKSLNSMSTELGVPLARMRPATEQQELANKWNEMGTDEPDLSRFRPVYAPKDFLEVVVSLRNPNHDSSEEVCAKSHWGLIQVPLHVKDIPQLTYLKMTMLTSETKDVLHYEQLKTGVIQHDLLVDNLIYKDVKLTASNDDYYFVFEDFLYQVLLCFSRDAVVLEHFKYNSATPPKSTIQDKEDVEHDIFYPPNGVIPFHGFSMYVAPLCFLYNEPSKLYSVFREMYTRYFFRLHSVSSATSGIVSLCLLFERLLQTHLPQLFYHLRQMGAQPLRIAFKWMVRAFSGYLSTDQLLFLWDRILGYDSLEPVAVLAAAVFAFRAENLMEVTCLASAEAVLADLSTLRVMPLLQIFLFATSV